MKKVAVVLGTRPEIIKLADVIHALGDRAFLVHSEQHYDENMSAGFFRELRLPAPDITLAGVGGTDRSTQVAESLQQLSAVFRDVAPGAALVQGDTNTVAAGALAASFLGVPLIHVEAGLRSYDRNMPEEFNRRIAGVLADVHCAATDRNRLNLLAEGTDDKAIFVTGNTIVEVTQSALNLLPATPPTAVADLETFILATIHRPENTDDPVALARILYALSDTSAEVVFVVHPRTRAAIARHGLEGAIRDFTLIEPTNHRDFLHLARHARLIVSDSGGIQEEATILKKPLVVVRRTTERPESIDAGFARLVPPAEDLTSALIAALHDDEWAKRVTHIPSPYGDGSASTTIARIAIRLADGVDLADAGRQRRLVAVGDVGGARVTLVD